MAGFYAFIDAKMVNAGKFCDGAPDVLLRVEIGHIWVGDDLKQG